jgi:choline monooxygenase
MSTKLAIDPRLAETLEAGAALPAEWYCDSNVLAHEKERIFHRSWQYVGHLGQAAQLGDFFTSTVGDIPVVITRSEDGKLRAFANVCRHRGSEVVLECSGNRKTLQCHYHGWTYNLDGSLRAAPHADEHPSFRKSEISLLALSAATWGPTIFVNPDPGAPPLDEITGTLGKSLADENAFESLRMLRRDIYQEAANWKIVIENFNECYHCPIAHPKLSRVIDVDEYAIDTSNEFFSTYRSPFRESRYRGLTYASLWPNAMLSAVSDPLMIQVMCAIPVDSDHSKVIFDYYLPDGASADVIRQNVEFSDLVQREDIALCESVQRGMRSRAIHQGRLMMPRERGVQHFQKLVYRHLSES